MVPSNAQLPDPEAQAFPPPGGHLLRAFSWSAAFLVVSRMSAIAAVPLVLGHLGSNLYAAWVLAGTLIMAQGLIDLGVGTALVRFVAIGATHGSRRAVLVILWRALAFYAGLSLLVGLPLWLFAGDLARTVSYLDAGERANAVIIVKYVAVSFGLTNLTLVLAALLQGLDRVGPSFRAQTLGWLLYVPVLATGLELGGGVHAVGLAWVAVYATQLALIAPATWRGVTRLPEGALQPPHWGEMLSLGGRWQAASWADFATFQLPRLVGGIALSSSALLGIDLAIRAAQAVVTPVFAFYPLVVPAASAAWATGGVAQVRALLDRWFRPAVLAMTLAAAAFLPLEGPALEAWTGHGVGQFDVWIGAAVLAGVVAHASTGILATALLAIGDIRSVTACKLGQLALAGPLMVPAAYAGVWAVALTVFLALTIPAIFFNAHATRKLDLRNPLRGQGRELVLATVAIIALPGIVVGLTQDLMPTWGVLAIAVPVSAVTCTCAWVGLRRNFLRRGGVVASPTPPSPPSRLPCS